MKCLYDTGDASRDGKVFSVVLWGPQTQLEGVLNKKTRFKSLMENECEDAYRVHQASHCIQNFPTPIAMSSDINN